MTDITFNLDRAKAGDNVVAVLGNNEEIKLEVEKFLWGTGTVSAFRAADGSIYRFLTQEGTSVDSYPLRLLMAEPVIPEGFIKYDPDKHPPNRAEEIEMLYNNGTIKKGPANLFTSDTQDYSWTNYNNRLPYEQRRLAYRVAKWKLPSEEWVRYEVGDFVPNDDDVESVMWHSSVFNSLRIVSMSMTTIDDWSHTQAAKNNVIAYRLKRSKLDEAIELMTMAFDKHSTDKRRKEAVEQFAQAIIDEVKK